MRRKSAKAAITKFKAWTIVPQTHVQIKIQIVTHLKLQTGYFEKAKSYYLR